MREVEGSDVFAQRAVEDIDAIHQIEVLRVGVVGAEAEAVRHAVSRGELQGVVPGLTRGAAAGEIAVLYWGSSTASGGRLERWGRSNKEADVAGRKGRLFGLR